jgi:hypothetical protein
MFIAVLFCQTNITALPWLNGRVQTLLFCCTTEVNDDFAQITVEASLPVVFITLIAFHLMHGDNERDISFKNLMI